MQALDPRWKSLELHWFKHIDRWAALSELIQREQDGELCSTFAPRQPRGTKRKLDLSEFLDIVPETASETVTQELQLPRPGLL